MGNVSSLARASTGLDSYVAELGNDLSYDRSLSSSRFLKTILARHTKGPLVLKIFIKPDPGMSLRVIQRRLKIERDTLVELPNIHTSQAFVETDKAGYLIRQWGRYNLYDRISTQPYLATVEKTWIAFQLLSGLRDARSRKIAHGDIKSENILVTSDLTVLITDFSTSFKPTYLPLDDPSDFSFFFDTSGRRTCYLAPERFFSSESQIARTREERDKDADQWGKRDGKVTEAMDIFSAGCVLLEMWTEGRGVFSLSDLYAYRDGALSLGAVLEGLEDNAVKSMIKSMLCLDPDQRPSFDRLLTSYRGSVFPEYFYIFYADYCLSLAETSREADEPSSDHVVRRLAEEWDTIQIYLERDNSEIPLKRSGVDEAGPALLLLDVVAANIRNCVWPTSRLRSLELLKRLSAFLTDEDVINRVVPYALTALVDDLPHVRGAACQAMIEMICAITSVTPQNAHFLPEYVLPALKILTQDPDVHVRCIYALSLVRLASKAVEVLEMAVALRSHDSEKPNQVDETDYDSLLQDITGLVEDHASALLIDPSSQVKRVMLSTVAELCLFFGRRKSNDFILSHIMTYLNDRDWALRYAFFEAIVGVGAFLGHVSIEEYVLPLMMQALADPEEYVIVRVIASLVSLASVGLFPRGRLWDLCQTLRPYLVHPNAWIRCGAAGFIAAAAQNIPQTDVWCILYPSLRLLLKADVKILDASSILDALRPPMSISTYKSAQSWAVQDAASPFWSKPSQSMIQSGKVLMLKTAVKASAVVSPAADSYLHNKGLPASEVENVVLLRDLILRQAVASQSRSIPEVNDNLERAFADPSVSLTSLGVTPITVFINQRIVDMDPSKHNLRKMGRLSSVVGTSSRRSSFASRAMSDSNPLEEIRKRLAHMEAKPGAPEDITSEFDDGLEAIMPQSEAIKTPSTTTDITPLSAMSKRGVSDSVKAAAAVGAVHTIVQGTVDTTKRNAGSMVSSGPSYSVPHTRALGRVSYTSTYEGRDPGVKALLDHVDLENYREPLVNFGPRVSASSTRKRSARTTVPRSKHTERTSTMIAHLSQHMASITCLITSPDNTFFASGSSDTTLSVWDTARLERSVSAKPRLTYRGFVAPITAMCTIEASHCLAVGSADGQMHIVRVHVVTGSGSPKYSRTECLQTWPAPAGSGAIVFLAHADPTTLIVVTTSGLIGVLDMRTWTLRKQLHQPVQHGAITSSCLDKAAQWIVIGSGSGHLALWDLRFGVLVRTWSASAPVLAIHRHPNRGRGRWVMVSVKSMTISNVVEVYDIDLAVVVERYRTGPLPNEGPPDKDLQDRSLAHAIADLSSSGLSTAARPPAALTLCTGEGFAANPSNGDGPAPLSPLIEGQTNSGSSSASLGFMIAAGEDRTVRFWSVGNVTDSFTVCGSPRERDAVFSLDTSSEGCTEFVAELPKVSQRSSTVVRSRLNREVETDQSARRSQALAQQVRQPLRPHYDAVSAVGQVETPYSSCVITGDRSGVIKVWRIEGIGTGG